MPTAQAAGGTTVVSNATFPLLGGFDLGFINLLLAFGALLALPSIPDIIDRSIGTLSQTGQLIGQAVGGGFSQGQRYAGQFQQGAGGFVGQAGRLTDQPGTQYYFDPQ
ncbi:hypothetical protein M1437_00505, partial [Patescibacteria group bacterium]|nr:hypothetical protein [Patescibacteria group bacterium]